MKLISFSMTTKAFLEGRKTVTRRLGWEWLKPGTRLEAVEKAMGLKPGEQVKRLGVIEVVDVRRERLDAITQEDVNAEGFGLDPQEFVRGFCKAMKCTPDTVVTRIEFRKIEKLPQLPAKVSDWPEAAREDLAERAAIVASETSTPKDRVEGEAERMTREAWERYS